MSNSVYDAYQKFRNSITIPTIGWSNPRPAFIRKGVPNPHGRGKLKSVVTAQYTIKNAYANKGKVLAIINHLQNGEGIRSTSRKTGSHTSTVAKIHRQMIAQNGRPFLCPCGLGSTHNGWCEFRLSKSSKRQAYVSKLKDHAKS